MKKNIKIKENLFLLQPMLFLTTLRKKAWFIVLITLICAIGAYFGLKEIQSQKWKATVKIIRYDKKISIPSDVPYQFQDFNYETALETIRTRKNLNELIKALALKETPEELFSMFDIKRERNSDIFEVSYTDTNKTLAVKGANTLSQIFIKNFSFVQNAAIIKVFDYYKIEKDTFEKQLLIASEQLRIFSQENNLLSLENEKENRYLQLQNLQLSALKNASQQKVLQVKTQKLQNQIKLLPAVVKLKYSVRSADKKTLEIKDKELKRLEQIYTASHPKIKMLKSDVRMLKKSISSSGANNAADEVTFGKNPFKHALELDLNKISLDFSASQQKEKTLVEQINFIKKELLRLNYLNKTYEKRKRQFESTKEQLLSITKRLHDLKMAVGASKEDFKILELAKAPRYPEKSLKKIIFVFVVFLGFIMTIGIVLLKEFLDLSIKTDFDLSERFGIEVLGMIPESDHNDRNIRKHFAHIIQKLLHNASSEKTILVASDMIGAGKSRFIQLLSEQFDFQKKSVLYLQTVKNLKGQEGLSLGQEFVLHPYPLSQYVDKAYWYLDADYGQFLPQQTDIKALMRELSSLKYDYIIIETPAWKEAEYLMASLIPECDLLILVTRFRHSLRKVIKPIIQLCLERNQSSIKGVINAVPSSYIEL